MPSAGGASGLRINNLIVRLKALSAPTIDGLTANVPSGTVAGLIGDNGSGKSTCAYAIIGLIPHHFRGDVRGELTLGGADLLLLDVHQRSSVVGYAFQDADSQVLFGTVADVIGLSEDNSDVQTISLACDVLGLNHLLEREPTELSGGQLQKVAFVAAVRRGPRLVILDEALTGLDPGARVQFGKFLSLLRERERAVIVIGQSAHDLKPYVDKIIKLPNCNGSGAAGRVGSALSDLTHQFRHNADTSDYTIVLRDVEARLGHGRQRFAFGPIDASMQKGQIVGLIGRNGSGKSTLQKLLLGSLQPTVGRIDFERHDKSGAKGNWRPSTGYISQFSHFQIISATIQDELRSYCPDMQGATFDKLMAAATKAFPFLVAGRDPLELSFGQQKMLSLVGLAVAGYSLLVLDEPELGLDDLHRQQLVQWLLHLGQTGSAAVVVASHDLDLISKCTSEVWLLDDGKLVSRSPTEGAAHLARHFMTAI